ncbi:hypothetical protein M0657_009621 [Pyricularia oryzae]|nr:hypothetical protein M0657_009621 [Pyricularia oryzae]KAI7922510.1 hypothetical protein M9X92_004803 [Pyricularia oryzae]
MKACSGKTGPIAGREQGKGFSGTDHKAPCVPVPQENPGAAAHFDARIWAVQCGKLRIRLAGCGRYR